MWLPATVVTGRDWLVNALSAHLSGELSGRFRSPQRLRIHLGRTLAHGDSLCHRHIAQGNAPLRWFFTQARDTASPLQTRSVSSWQKYPDPVGSDRGASRHAARHQKMHCRHHRPHGPHRNPGRQRKSTKGATVPCTMTTAAERATIRIDRPGPNLRSTIPTEAERRQKRDCCAAAPKMTPPSATAMASAAASPYGSSIVRSVSAPPDDPEGAYAGD